MYYFQFLRCESRCSLVDSLWVKVPYVFIVILLAGAVGKYERLTSGKYTSKITLMIVGWLQSLVTWAPAQGCFKSAASCPTTWLLASTRQTIQERTRETNKYKNDRFFFFFGSLITEGAVSLQLYFISYK